MPFRSLDTLRIFDVVARHMSFTAAATELHLTKGAISYQIKQLENAIGFSVFERRPNGIALTDKGRKLWHISQTALQTLQQEIAHLQESDEQRITIGMSTYFASRWLSPRLMKFTSRHTHIGLRLQPVAGLIDLGKEDIDMAIRWGNGRWTDCQIEQLFQCPAIATAGAVITEQIKQEGLEKTLTNAILLHDYEESTSWSEWYTAAGIPYLIGNNDLVIPDPNVRVQAVIDGQGLALNDSLVNDELNNRRLFQVSPVALDDYGYYLAYPEGALDNPALRSFRDWIIGEAKNS